MMRLITADDIRDVALKVKQRGLDFVLSKFTFSEEARTKSAFNATALVKSNWWDIPYVRERWNVLISGNKDINFKEYLVTEFLSQKSGLKMLSLGSGSCGHEIQLAQYPHFAEITCVDLSDYRISEARKAAASQELENMVFVCKNIDEFEFRDDYFDIVFFNASLHHFKDVEKLLTSKVNSTLKNGGLLVINEYVGPDRLQFSKYQIKKVTEAIQTIPKIYRQYFKSKTYKTRFSGSGLIRMVVADPSECVDSSSILPTIHNHFETLVEKPYGGNILMNALKGISYHFIEMDARKQEVLNTLFEIEDEFMKENMSDFCFGVYRLNKN